jgi:hypothetical protein
MPVAGDLSSGQAMESEYIMVTVQHGDFAQKIRARVEGFFDFAGVGAGLDMFDMTCAGDDEAHRTSMHERALDIAAKFVIPRAAPSVEAVCILDGTRGAARTIMMTPETHHQLVVCSPGGYGPLHVVQLRPHSREAPLYPHVISHRLFSNIPVISWLNCRHGWFFPYRIHHWRATRLRLSAIKNLF